MKNKHKNRYKISKFDLLIHLLVKVKKDDIFALASQQSYYLILAFFPFIISLASLVGYINLGSNDMIEGLKNILPTSIFELSKSTIKDVLGSQRTGLFSISILVSFWMSSAGFKGVIKGINKAYNIIENRSYIRRTAIAFISTIALALTIFMALIILVFGKVLSDYIISIVHYNQLISVIWILLRYVIMIVILVFVFSAIYKFIPAKRLKWKEVFPGAFVATMGWLILSFGFSFYINNFNNYSKFYGSLAAVFILMLWIFLISIILIFGVEVNSVLVEKN
jgi:membrane protein